MELGFMCSDIYIEYVYNSTIFSVISFHILTIKTREIVSFEFKMRDLNFPLHFWDMPCQPGK